MAFKSLSSQAKLVILCQESMEKCKKVACGQGGFLGAQGFRYCLNKSQLAVNVDGLLDGS